MKELVSDPLSIIEKACLQLRLSEALPDDTVKLIADAANWYHLTNKSITWDEIYSSVDSIKAAVRMYVIMVGSNRKEITDTLPEGFDEALMGMIVTDHISKLISDKYSNFDEIAKEEEDTEPEPGPQQKEAHLGLWCRLRKNWAVRLKALK